MPASSRAVFSTSTLNLSRNIRGSAFARSMAMRMPIASRCAVIRRPMPQTSFTSVLRNTQSRLKSSVISTTPPVCACSRLAVWLASFARVLVRAIPTPTGIPVQCSTLARTSRPNWVRFPCTPVRSAKHSSIE